MKIQTLAIATLLSQATIAQTTEGTPDIIRGDDYYELIVHTYDDETRERVDDAEIYLYNTKTDDLVSSQETVDGLATFQIEPFTEYEIRSCHPDYLRTGFSMFECHEGKEVLCVSGASDYTYVAGGGKDKPRAILKADIGLDKLAIGSVFELSHVYYDLDESHLRPRGKAELDELVMIMERNKTIRIELASHTDSRASQDYNHDLSQRRAQSCVDYMIAQGIASSRLVPKGYGETRLLNECSDGVECTEAQHQRNRRTEIEVLDYQAIECVPSKDIDFANKDLSPDLESK